MQSQLLDCTFVLELCHLIGVSRKSFSDRLLCLPIWLGIEHQQAYVIQEADSAVS